MSGLFVKICGITRAEDAGRAAAAGAGAIGLVFWPGSPRYVDPDRAAAIVAGLPAFVTAVGVFVNQSVDEVNRIARAAGLGAVQLHGDEPVEYAQAVERPVVKAIAVNGSETLDVEEWPASMTLLLDAHDPARRGGTGRTIDWNAAAAIARRRRTLLAGGLRPGNVAEAVARVRPFGIDVSSGVEASPGLKDAQLIAALFAAVTPEAGRA